MSHTSTKPQIVAGVDLGGTAINYTLVNPQEQFLIEGLCEYPARSKEGPGICLQQIVDGLKVAVALAGLPPISPSRAWIRLGRPPQRACSARKAPRTSCIATGAHSISAAIYPRAGHSGHLFERRQRRRALGSLHHLRRDRPATSLAAMIGTGLGGGIITAHVVKGRRASAANWATCCCHINIRGIEGMLRPATAGVSAIWNRFVR